MGHCILDGDDDDEHDVLTRTTTTKVTMMKTTILKMLTMTVMMITMMRWWTTDKIAEDCNYLMHMIYKHLHSTCSVVEQTAFLHEPLRPLS